MMYCPKCKRPMIFLETLTDCVDETKTAWACNEDSCNVIAYIVEFYDERKQNDNSGRTYQHN